MDFSSVHPGYFRDILGYTNWFSNPSTSAEYLQAGKDAYSHLFNFRSLDDINEFYANQDSMSFDELGSFLRSGLNDLVGQAAEDLTNFSGLDFNSLIPDEGLFSPNGQPTNYNNAFGVGSGTLDPGTNQYLNAELAKFYGMDRNTAYQEALSNTAYQRAVADMQRAGLNPAAIFGAGRGSTAGGVAFIGGSNSASGYSDSSSKLFASDTYGMIAALSGLATAVVTKRPQNFWLGQQAAQGVMQTLNVIDRKFSK